MELSTKDRVAIKVALRELLRNPPVKSDMGICGNLYIRLPQTTAWIVYDVVSYHTKSWDGWSGNQQYPITTIHSAPSLTPPEQYKLASEHLLLWKGTQLEQRRNLIMHLLIRV